MPSKNSPVRHRSSAYTHMRMQYRLGRETSMNYPLLRDFRWCLGLPWVCSLGPDFTLSVSMPGPRPMARQERAFQRPRRAPINWPPSSSQRRAPTLSKQLPNDAQLVSRPADILDPRLESVNTGQITPAFSSTKSRSLSAGFAMRTWGTVCGEVLSRWQPFREAVVFEMYCATVTFVRYFQVYFILDKQSYMYNS